jgi:hypothetical protein
VSEEHRDPVSELAQGMEAAGALIESLEEEVISLRRDLEQASVALQAAQEEAAARRRALEKEESARRAAQGEVDLLRAEVSEAKTAHADETLQLRNQHINELAELQRKLEEQRRADLEAATSEGRVEALKEEFRREREALEERHAAELEALKTSAEQWEETLRESYREQEERHSTELESLRLELERQRSETERTLREDFEWKLAEEKRTTEERHEAALQAISSAAAGRELELEQGYRAVVESQQAEIEALRGEIETNAREAEDRRKRDLREVKTLAENREREARRAHAARLAEAETEAERRLAALQSQREADNQALRARHAEELARVRREYEERLAAEDERRKAETWALEERLAEARIQRDTEHRTYTARLRELEAARLEQKVSAKEDLEGVVEGFGAEIFTLESRVAELEDALRDSEERRESLEGEHAQLSRTLSEGEVEPPSRGAVDEESVDERRHRELDAARLLAEERAADLEARLREAQEASARNARELENALETLQRFSEPGRRVREGIALFNASEHARTVASISKALGLPHVHAGLDDDLGKPVLTFAWPEMAWRRYISDPTEGVEEPRVYLIGTGDDPAELEGPESRPNARMDAQGHLMLGVQAR